MYFGGGSSLLQANNTFWRGRKVDGTIVSLIGVNAADVVSLDPGGLGVVFGGLIQNATGSFKISSTGQIAWSNDTFLNRSAAGALMLGTSGGNDNVADVGAPATRVRKFVGVEIGSAGIGTAPYINFGAFITSGIAVQAGVFEFKSTNDNVVVFRGGIGPGATPEDTVIRAYTAKNIVLAARVVIPAVTVATLPATPVEGMRASVTDSNAASYTAGIGTVVVAGGTTHVPVFYDGTNWRIG